MTFYETLEIAMNKRGMRPVDICKKTGFNPTYFTHLKTGHIKSVTWERALMIIAALDMTPNEFLALQNGDDAQ